MKKIKFILLVLMFPLIGIGQNYVIDAGGDYLIDASGDYLKYTASSFTNDYYVTFDGSNESAGFTEVVLTDPYSISFWVRTASTVEYVFGASTTSDYVKFQTSSRITFRMGGASINFDLTVGSFSVDTWYHIVLLKTSANLMTLYVNNTEEDFENK